MAIFPATLADMLDVQTLFIIVAVVLLVKLLTSSGDNRKLPPGPPGLPIIGNILQVRKKNPYLTAYELREEYPDMIRFKSGTLNVVLLNSYEAIKEMLSSEIFSDRPYVHMAWKNSKGKGVINHRLNPQLKEVRKFTLTALRDFGVGKNSLEVKVREEVEALESFFLEHNSQAVNPQRCLQNATCNIISSIVFGKRREYDDPKFQELLNAVDKLFASAGGGNILNAFPYLDNPIVRLFAKNLYNASDSMIDIKNYMRKELTDHRETFDENNVRDFIDLYLVAERHKDNNTIDEEEMFEIIKDLFLAGTETTSTTLSWALLFMVHHPDVQRKIQEEIEQVTGNNRMLCFKDREDMPYTVASLYEIQRISNIAPTSLPHTPQHDVTFRGYTIPKGTLVFPNLYALHMDEKLWPEPFKFDPHRWLDENNKAVHREAFLPFSLGRRVCLGEQLARMELFNIFTGLLQKFEFTVPDGKPTPALKARVSGVTRVALPFEICATKRGFV